MPNSIRKGYFSFSSKKYSFLLLWLNDIFLVLTFFLFTFILNFFEIFILYFFVDCYFKYNEDCEETGSIDKNVSEIIKTNGQKTISAQKEIQLPEGMDRATLNLI